VAVRFSRINAEVSLWKFEEIADLASAACVEHGHIHSVTALYLLDAMMEWRNKALVAMQEKK
jgi:hypothetical protein